jgi:uncharacterized protein
VTEVPGNGVDGHAYQRPSPPALIQQVFPGRFLSITSLKRDGTGVATPVWFVSDGRRLYALTDLHSPKVWRIRRNPTVLMASCRANGRLRREAIPARAEVHSATPELERVQRLLRDRYKVSYRVVMLAYRLGRRLRGDAAVADGAALVLSLEEPLHDEHA